MNAAQRDTPTRERLLEVAEKEFARYGYAGAHLQSIGEQVGVQKTALYYYFASKSALHTAVIQSMLEAFEQVLGTALERPGTHRERLQDALASFNQLLARRPHYGRILIRIFIDGAGVDYEQVAPAIERVIGGVMAFHREGVKAGAFAPRSSRHFFLSFFGMTLFHYAAPEFSARILGVEDVFAEDVRGKRRDEVQSLLLEGVLPRTPRS
jgi:TetR/AcrR family transcriptional regulator